MPISTPSRPQRTMSCSIVFPILLYFADISFTHLFMIKYGDNDHFWRSGRRSGRRREKLGDEKDDDHGGYKRHSAELKLSSPHKASSRWPRIGRRM